jgi:hypothetical protein
MWEYKIELYYQFILISRLFFRYKGNIYLSIDHPHRRLVIPILKRIVRIS